MHVHLGLYTGCTHHMHVLHEVVACCSVHTMLPGSSICPGTLLFRHTTCWLHRQCGPAQWAIPCPLQPCVYTGAVKTVLAAGEVPHLCVEGKGREEDNNTCENGAEE